MKITISGKQMTVRPSLKELSEKKLARFERFFGEEAEVDVCYSCRHDLQYVEITIYYGGTIFRCEEGADTFQTAIDEALESRSPLHLAKAGRMPEIPYRVFHCIDDAAVNIYAHSESFIKALGEGYDVQLVKIPHRSHTDLSPKAAYLYREAILNSLK